MIEFLDKIQYDFTMKNRKIYYPLLFSASFLFISACTTSSPIMQANDGEYTITKSAATGFTPLGVLRKKAYEDAAKFATSKNLIAEVISVNEVPAGFARWPQVDLHFRLVSASASKPSSKSDVVSVNSNISHDAMGNPSSIQETVKITKKEDLYTELSKLGELRQKGLLTEDEFLKAKKKLLDSQ